MKSAIKLTQEQAVIATALVAVGVLAWVTSLLGIGPMMNTSAFPVDIQSISIFTASWTVGMVAMMFPTAVPMLMLFMRMGKGSTQEIRAGGGPTILKAVLFSFTYLVAWGIMGIIFYSLFAGFDYLASFAKFSDSFAISFAFLLLLVGAYQLTPLKGECLARCHPTNFLYTSYRSGRKGAIEMGLLYAKYCVGCCWAMMIFLILAGAMGVLWMLFFTGLIFSERVLVRNLWITRAIGFVFLSAGVLTLTLGLRIF